MPFRTVADVASCAPRSYGFVLVAGPPLITDAVARSLRQLDPQCEVVVGSDGPRANEPSLVILTAAGRGDRIAAGGWLTRGVRHLPVAVALDAFTVGPLVAPGRSACLHCVDARVRDGLGAAPAMISTSLLAGDAPLDPMPEPGVLAMAATTAAMIAGAALSGVAPQGVSLEAASPWPRMTQRRWHPHPLCPCGAWEASGHLIEQNQSILTDPPHVSALAG